MATTKENKTLDQLITKFTEASDQAKGLDKVISNFSTVIEEFHVTMLEMEEKVKVKDLSNLSKEAMDRLNEIKSFDELQLLDKLETVIKKQVNGQLKTIQKQITDNKKDSLAKIDNQFQKMTIILNSAITENENQEGSNKQDEILALLQRIESQTRFTGNNGWAPVSQNNEDLMKLRRLVSSLNIKYKKLEEDYEERISLLENEIELLKSKNPFIAGTLSSNDIDDEDLPF